MKNSKQCTNSGTANLHSYYGVAQWANQFYKMTIELLR